MTDATPTIAALQQRIAELEQQVRDLTQTQEFFQFAIDALPQTIFWKDRDLIYRGCSQRFAAFAGYDSPAAVAGKSDYDLAWKREESEAFRADDRAVLAAEQPRYHIVESQRHADGAETWVETNKAPIRDGAGRVIGVVGSYEDITARRLREQERLHEQELLIEAQTAALAELSTPLIPLTDEVVVMPLVGAIDSRRAQQIMEVLLEGIAAYQADMVILDISGVRVVDTQVADALLRATRAARLLGAQVLLTGISAEIAQTMVHLGAEMAGVVTHANLRAALLMVLNRQPT